LWYLQQEFGDERLMEREGWLGILCGFKVHKAIYYMYARPLAPACGVASPSGEARPLEMYFSSW
jgi:hypothetical protein